jgi:tight adherence protein B
VESGLALLTVFALVALVVGMQRAFTPDTSAIDERLRRYGVRRAELDEVQAREAVSQMMAQHIERAISNRGFAKAMQAELSRANLRLTVVEFLGFQLATTLGLAVLALLISGGFPPAVIIAAGVGYLLPRLWVRRRQGARLKAFNDQLADTITLMSNSLRSGLSLVQSMDLVAKEGSPPMSEEFARVTREIGLGNSPTDALVRLVERVNSEDLDLLVTAILVQHEVGGNLAKILDTIAGTIRERVKLKGEIKTLTAQQRLAGYMLALLPVFVGGILSLIAPSYIGKLFTSGPWLVLPVCAVVGIVFGFFVIGRIVDIEI